MKELPRSRLTEWDGWDTTEVTSKVWLFKESIWQWAPAIMITMLTPLKFCTRKQHLPILLTPLCASKTELIGKEEKNRASGSFTYKWFSDPSKTTKRLQPVQKHLNPTAQNRDQTSRLTQAVNKLWIFNMGESYFNRGILQIMFHKTIFAARQASLKNIITITTRNVWS